MKLAAFLERHSLTRREFAEQIGVSEVAVTRYLTGTRLPRPRHFRKIREVTRGEVTYDDFVPDQLEEHRGAA